MIKHTCSIVMDVDCMGNSVAVIGYPCGVWVYIFRYVRYVAVNYSRLVLKHKGSMCVFSSPPPPPHTHTHSDSYPNYAPAMRWCFMVCQLRGHSYTRSTSPITWINMHEVVVALTNWFHCSMNIWLFILDRKHTFILRTIMHNLRINAFAEM